MNNSYLTVESLPEELDVTPLKEERVGQLKVLVEAVRELKASNAWSTLKEEIYGQIEHLERLQKQELSKQEFNTPELYRLQGRLIEAKTHSLDALEQRWATELSSLKKQL